MIQAVRAGSDMRGRSERWRRGLPGTSGRHSESSQRHPGRADLSRGHGGPGDSGQRLS